LRAETAESRETSLRERVQKLSAKGDVPSFVGSQLADVESDQSVTAYNWKIRTTEQISTQPSGTVLSQRAVNSTRSGQEGATEAEAMDHDPDSHGGGFDEDE